MIQLLIVLEALFGVTAHSGYGIKDNLVAFFDHRKKLLPFRPGGGGTGVSFLHNNSLRELGLDVPDLPLNALLRFADSRVPVNHWLTLSCVETDVR